MKPLGFAVGDRVRVMLTTQMMVVEGFSGHSVDCVWFPFGTGSTPSRGSFHPMVLRHCNDDPSTENRA